MPPDSIVIDDRDPTTQFISERVLVGDSEPDIMRAPPGTTTDGITILEEGEGQPEIRYIDRTGNEVGAPDAGSRSERRAAKRARRADKRAVDKMARGGKRRRWPWILVAVLLVGGAATGGWGYWYDNVREVTHVVPDPGGAERGRRGGADRRRAVDGRTNRDATDGTVPGQILDQDPAPGTHLKEGGVLALTVSLGPPLVALPPDLVGKTLDDATAALAASGFALGEVTKQFDEEVSGRCRARTRSRSTPADAEGQCRTARRLRGPCAPHHPRRQRAHRRPSASETRGAATERDHPQPDDRGCARGLVDGDSIPRVVARSRRVRR